MAAGRYRELREAVEKVRLVDAHAHNLVEVDSEFPFLRCFSEAEGAALGLATQSLSFKRSLRDLAALYGCEASLPDLEEYRKSEGLDAITTKCFKAANISAILLDDGIIFDKMLYLEWHKSYAPVVGRILRIENLAETILNEAAVNASTWTFNSFLETFLTKMKSAAGGIVGFKSIAAYRSGLEIDPNVSKIEAEEGLQQELNTGKPVRITNKKLIDYLFTCSLEIAALFDLPMQIHTGFGDKDLDLRLSNPLHLRKVLEDQRFSTSKIVLLHASYPFSKEASYLSSVYSQVYIDFGLAIPKLSVQGMITSLKELLELAPLSKVMFSSDGYAFPETFYLGAKRSRDVVFSVLCDACDDGDLTLSEAIRAVDDIFVQNALCLYKLSTPVGSIYKEGVSALSNMSNPLTQDDAMFIRIVWNDISGHRRCRVVPSERFHEVTKTHGVGLTQCAMALVSFMDAPAEGSNLTATGEIRLMPDLSTICRLPWSTREAMVLADMHIKPGESWDYCPRNTLRRVSAVLLDEFNLEVNAGFENEFYFLRKETRYGKEEWTKFDSSPYCATSAFDAATPILQEIYTALKSMNIEVEQLHAEAGKGQFEISLKHDLCIHSADKLIYTREAIKSIARKHGLLATFLPKYYLDDIGSGSHVHLSLFKDGVNVFIGSADRPIKYGMSEIGEHFMAGVYEHLPSILAFTAPLPNSYDRIQPNTWSGAYICWGKENREAPLRTACPPGVPHELVSNFELKSFDGCANPHLGLAAIVAAGIDGLRRGLTLPEPMELNPSDYASQLKRLPKNLQESVDALAMDGVLHELIGKKIVATALAVKRMEIDYYRANPRAYKDLVETF